MSEYLSLETLTTPRPVKELDVDVAELGGKVRLRGFTVRQRTAFEKSVEGKNRTELRERLIVATVVKPEGLTVAHVRALGDMNAAVLEPLVEAALAITGFTDRDLESLAKNSDATADDSSTSS